MDIKPENILLNVDKRGKITDLRLADFGLSVQVKRTDFEPSKGGSLGYMAPEMMQEKTRLDNRLDSYSLGVLLYNLICGCMPPENKLTLKKQKS